MEKIQREIIPITDDDLFIVLDHPNAKFDYSVHYHPEYEINLVMNTSGTRIVGDSEEKFDMLDLVMIGSNLPHAWKGNNVEGNHVITIQFSDNLFNFPILEKRLFASIKHLLLDSQRGIVFSENVHCIKEKIIHLAGIRGFHTILDFFSILDILSRSKRRFLVTNQYDTKNTIRTSKSLRITKICKYIEKNYQNTITITDVARLINMSDSAFCHFFKKRTNQTFVEYVNNIRISKACQMLMETSHTIAEICYTCGFYNLSHFIRTFKKKKGHTPKEYRNSIRQLLIKY